MTGRLIGLTGYAQSGKDTVGQYLVTEHKYHRIGFADAVRDAVYTLNPMIKTDRWETLQEYIDYVGWDRAKVDNSEARRLLQIMGTEVGRMLFGPDVWINIAERKAGSEPRVVITDVRFPNEADWIRSRGGIVVRVDRSGVGPVNGHASDQLAFSPDMTIDNVGTIDELYAEVDRHLPL